MGVITLLKIIANSSSSYAPRTYANASKGDITAAIAIDYETAGERLTKKAAGQKYIRLPMSIEGIEQSYEEHGRTLATMARPMTEPCINIAGNGIYTFARHKWDQARVNQYIYQVLAIAHQQHPIGSIVCGGQTGVDIAGAVAAVALNIPVTIHMPSGLLQRYEDGQDITRTEDQIRDEVMSMARQIKGIVILGESTPQNDEGQHQVSANQEEEAPRRRSVFARRP
ncbi:hypothetical protein ACKF11_13795 [Methylobacillus sp. Pita2]|uniref:hypothetical protein n=1 Tax=Methylobacillus sp. Pita2 TaxID=3383245 RepID=UPI0038B56F92